MTPRPYQEEAIQHLVDLHNRGLRGLVNGSDMGTGKTLQAIELMRRLDLPTLAVVPKVTVPSWDRHAAEQGTDVSAINWEMVRTGRTPYGKWDDAGEFHWDPAIKFLIFDEAHRAMGRDSKNSQLVRAARRQNILSLVMSATLADTPLEMDALGYVLRLHDGYRPKTTLRDVMQGREVVSFSQWTAKHGCGLVDGEWAFRGTETARAKHMAKINAALYPHKGVRIRIPDLGDQFPECQITAELYETDQPDRVDRLYAEMAAQLAVLYERMQQDVGGPATDNLRAHQEIELLKVPVLLDQTQEAISAGRSVCLFVNYRATLQELCRRLGTNCFIDGTQAGPGGAKRREENRQRFQQDLERAIIIQNEAGGVGLDLPDIHGEYPRTSLVSPGFNAKTARQVSGRTRRDTSQSKSQVRFIFLRGTCEERIHKAVDQSIQKALARKLNHLDALNDGDLMPENMRIYRTF